MPSPAGTLKVTFRGDDPKWQILAPACWDLRLPGFEPVTCAPFSKVQRGRLEREPANVYLKKFLVRGRGDAIKGLFRESRAHRAWRGGLLIENEGFKAPHARCIIRPRSFLAGESMLVTDEIADAVSVRSRLTDPLNGVPASGREREGFIRAFAHEVAAWHNAGLYHGDMRLGNILTRRTERDWEFIWLDNERARKFRRLPARKREQNLMQINMEREGVSPADRFCFWRAYARTVHLSGRALGRTARRVRAWTRKRWRARGWLTDH